MFDPKEIADKAEVAKRGVLKDQELSLIQSFIKDHYQEMYEMWRERSVNGFYNGD